MEIVAKQPLIVEFWDVGQGDCTVLHLPSGELILIDVGPRNSPLPGWLTRNGSSSIHSIILTHNHADHIGALNSVIEACRSRIGTVYYLNDSSTKDETFVKLNKRLVDARARNEIRELRRLEVPLEIWSDAETKCCFALNYPDVAQNTSAKTSNDTSGILSLSVGSVTKIIWSSDSRIEYLASECSETRPDYMVGPHHGAPEDRRDERALEWLKAVSPQKVVLSVGTNNSHKHPQVNFIRDVRKAGGNVVCTQLTPRCEDKRKIIKDVVKSHARLGLPHPNTGYGCRGPIRLTLRNGELISTDNLDLEHAMEIKKLNSPRCVESF